MFSNEVYVLKFLGQILSKRVDRCVSCNGFVWVRGCVMAKRSIPLTGITFLGSL